jgi:hypothetical protein
MLHFNTWLSLQNNLTEKSLTGNLVINLHYMIEV